MSSDMRAEALLSLDPSELFDDEIEYRHLCRLFEKEFGEGIFGPSKKTVPFASKRSARRPAFLNPFRKTGYTEVYQNKNGIKFTLDVQQFKVGELTVKVVDQCVVIDGKHKDRKDYHGFISRSFTRSFFLPKHIDPSTLQVKLSLDGLLIITATSKGLPAPHVRTLGICCTRKRALTNTTYKEPTKQVRPQKRVRISKNAKTPKSQKKSLQQKPQQKPVKGNGKPQENVKQSTGKPQETAKQVAVKPQETVKQPSGQLQTAKSHESGKPQPQKQSGKVIQ